MYDLVIEERAENQFFFHPRYQHLVPGINHALEAHKILGQFCILSSGTTSNNPKGYALSFDALLTSAKAVHERLKLTRFDRWGLCLPPYHIAGLSVFVRSLLVDQKPAILHPWDPLTVAENITLKNVTVISLVPAQIYDLVALNISCPKNLKVVLVGGDFFGDELENRALALGWPVVRTFGMTEVASGLATGGDLIHGLRVLPHHEIKTDSLQRLWVKSRSLYTCEFKMQDEWEIKMAKNDLDSEGFYPLSDRAELLSGGIIPLGRDDGSFKSSGHLISLPELKNKLDRFMLDSGCWGKMDLILTSDRRKGKILTLVYEQNIAPQVISALDELLSPIRIELKNEVESLSKTELGKTIIHFE
jgi:O-succinylbenzoic acid--CoA ligase